MIIPEDFRVWFMARPLVERELIMLLMQHANDKGLSAIEMAEALESARALYLSMHEATRGSRFDPG
jgi:hypothetical protein